MALAIFDLDNTLLAGDSDYLWGRFLVDKEIVDGSEYTAENERFYQAYQTGTLDIHGYLRFALRPLAQHEPGQLRAWRAQFIDERIRPIVLDQGRELVESHRSRGDTLLIITATNRFLTEPIAALFGIDHLLATDPEMAGERYTGAIQGIPTFREGKIKALETWSKHTGHQLTDSYFYSDSHNDIPLLERVAYPVAVDPDPELRQQATQRGWPIISLR
ncbi:MAG: HAD family phosphatase [Nitrococcus mobilis]|nr:HAD family phosphatase [Nitrococcus mobilis]